MDRVLAYQFSILERILSEVFRGSPGRCRHVNGYLVENIGSSPSQAAQQSNYVISAHLNKQAFIEGVNDDFLLAGIITLIGGIPIFFLHSRKKKEAIAAALKRAASIASDQ